MSPEDDPIGCAQGLVAAGQAGKAAELLRDMLARGRGGLLARVTLAHALIAAGDLEEAVSIARESALTNPDAAIGALSLGEAMLASGRLAAAIGEFQRALRLDPAFARARSLLGEAWLAAGEAEKALEAFESIADTDAPNELTAKIAEARGMQMRPRSDPRYVRHLFDEFSANYDSRMLDQLSYEAPAILRQLARMLGVNESRKYAVLDLGCGTGLSGASFKDIAARLDGIDLSPAMIEKARARGIYDGLIVGDLEEWAEQHNAQRDGRGSLRERYDLILAADTLVYLGDLRKIFAGVKRHLFAGGTFLFTVEKSDTEGFELSPKRRWRHSENYVRKQAEDVGFEVGGLLCCHPRTEAGVPVEGLAVALKALAEKVG